MKNQNYFLVYILLIPFLSAFGIVGWVSLPMIYIIIIAPFVMAIDMKRIQIRNRDYLLLALLPLGFISSLLSPVEISMKTATHLFGWAFSVFIFYGFMSWWIRSLRPSLDEISKYFFYGALVASTGVHIDFFLANFYGFYLSDVIHYSFGPMDPTESFSGLLKRPRGFGAEPGFTALVFEMFMPLAFYRLYKGCRVFFSVVFFLYIASAYLLLTSAASLASLFVGIFIGFLLFFSAKGNVVYLKRMILPFLLIILCVFTFWDYLYFYYTNSIGLKLDLIVNSSSLRFNIYASLLELFQRYPVLGIGFGSLSHAFDVGGLPVELHGAGAINLFLEVLIIGGLAGFFLFVMFILISLKTLYAYKAIPHVALLAVSLVSVLTHHIFISEPWFPVLWLLFALSSNVPIMVHAISGFDRKVLT